MDEDDILSGLLIALIVCFIVILGSVSVAYVVHRNQRSSYTIIVDDKGNACVK